MAKTDWQQAQESDSKGMPIRDWRPGRISKKYRDNYDKIRWDGDKNIRADKKELDK